MTGDSGLIPISLGVSDFSDWDISFVLVFGDHEDRQSDTALQFLSSLLQQNVRGILMNIYSIYCDRVLYFGDNFLSSFRINVYFYQVGRSNCSLWMPWP